MIKNHFFLHEKLVLYSCFLGLIFGCSSGKKEDLNGNPRIYSNGTKIDYVDRGKGEMTLLFVHGWCIDKSYWEPQLRYFEDRYRVVALDLPGHGNSGKSREKWTIEQFGADVITLIDALELRNVILIGHSMGGNIVLEAASKRPGHIIGFVGVDNFKEVGIDFTPEQASAMADFIVAARQDYEQVIQNFAERILFAHSTERKIVDKVLKDMLDTPPEIAIAILESLMDVNVKERSQMRKLKLKVHLINSDLTPTNELQLKKYCNYDFSVHSIGNTGHYPMIESPEKFNEILQGILNEL